MTIDIYLDYRCPACKAYEERAGATTDELVAAGRAKVVYHPVAHLDRYSSTRYATRAARAAACAADAGVFPAYSICCSPSSRRRTVPGSPRTG